MSMPIIFGGVAVFALGVAVGWLINHHAFACLQKALKSSANIRNKQAADIGLLTEELDRMEAYAEELEQADQQRKKELAIAIESSDRWRNEAFETQNRLSDVTNQLATEKRRAAAFLGWNRIYRRTKGE